MDVFLINVSMDWEYDRAIGVYSTVEAAFENLVRYVVDSYETPNNVNAAQYRMGEEKNGHIDIIGPFRSCCAAYISRDRLDQRIETHTERQERQQAELESQARDIMETLREETPRNNPFLTLKELTST